MKSNNGSAREWHLGPVKAAFQIPVSVEVYTMPDGRSEIAVKLGAMPIGFLPSDAPRLKLPLEQWAPSQIENLFPVTTACIGANIIREIYVAVRDGQSPPNEVLAELFDAAENVVLSTEPFDVTKAYRAPSPSAVEKLSNTVRKVRSLFAFALAFLLLSACGSTSQIPQDTGATEPPWISKTILTGDRECSAIGGAGGVHYSFLGGDEVTIFELERPGEPPCGSLVVRTMSLGETFQFYSEAHGGTVTAVFSAQQCGKDERECLALTLYKGAR